MVLSLVPGGTERLVLDLVRRSRPECVSAVCCLDEPGAWAPELQQEGVPVVSLGRQPGFHPGLGVRIAAFAREFKADVLHCHQYSAFVYGRIGAFLARTALVFTEHGRLADSKPSTKRRLINPVLGRLSGGGVFSVSRHLRAHMIAEGFPAGNVHVIHNGIDPGSEPTQGDRQAARATIGAETDDFVVGTAARLDPVKDFPMLFEAFRRVRKAAPHARLVLLGDGPERERLERERVSLGLQDAIVLLGHRQDVRSLLPGFDVFVNSSISEGISLTILEGMAAELPVVATAVGGTTEVVQPGTTGLLVPARDPAALADALLILQGNREQRRVLGVNGRRQVLEHFTIERMVGDYVAEYQRAAGGG